MTPKEAAEKLRPDFHLHAMPPEDRHHVKFVEDVATELGIEHTPFNLHQVADALDAADLHGDSLDYPKMFYSSAAHPELPSNYDARHKWYSVIVASEKEAEALGSDWTDTPHSAKSVEEEV